MNEAKPNAFAIVFAVVCSLLIVLLFFLLFFTRQGFEAVDHSIAIGAMVITIGLALYIALLAAILFLRAARIPVPKILFRQAWSLISLLFPFIIKIGKIFGYSREITMLSFVGIANKLNSPAQLAVRPDKILLILPHCIQIADCKVRINTDPKSCLRCGRCKIAELLALTERYGVEMVVVTGGTLARKKIRDIRPQAVLAVACERDLTAGLQDVFPLPTIGILNKRPYGPCFNTDVDVAEVEARLIELIGGAAQGGKSNECT
ncbi:MAG: DUF116 domain-containing protein [Bacillota bacterium]